MVEVRHTSQQLASAIESTVNTIFSSNPTIRREWQNTELMLWEIDCEICANIIQDPSTEDMPLSEPRNRHTLSLQLERGPKNTSILANPWRLRNNQELEGLLGLWLWSLKSDPVVEREDPQNHLKTSQANEIPIRRIVATDRKMAETDLRVWLNDRISRTEFKLQSSGDPSTIWQCNSDGLYGPLLLPHNLHQGTFRFFGWHAAEGWQPRFSEPFRVWSVLVNGSLLSSCACEVFGSFVKSITGVIDDIGSLQIRDDEPGFRLDNRLVSGIVKSFTDSQLGSESEALSCILPAVIPRLRMPSLESALMIAVKSANQHRRKKEFGKAEAILERAWTNCAAIPNHNHRETPENLIELGAVALGELDRLALRGIHTEQFGSNGIEWLLIQISSLSQPLSNSLYEIIHRYGTIKNALFLPKYSANIDFPSTVKNGNLTEALIFLTRGTPDMSNEVKGNALCLAARQGWTEVVLSLLELATEPDYKDSNLRTALSHAAESGSIHFVKELMDWGAFPNAEDEGRRTPLSWASENGHEMIVKMLLTDIRTFLDSRDNSGWTPLSLAASNGHEMIVKILLDKDAGIEAKDRHGQTPLSRAAIEGHEMIVNMLLDRNANIEAENRDGKTPLSLAAENGHEIIVKMLLEKNANIKAENGDEQALLSLAVKKRHVAAIKMKLDRIAENDNGMDKHHYHGQQDMRRSSY